MKKILILEDNAGLAQVLTEWLNEKYDARAITGENVVAALESNKDVQFDLIILNYMKMTGACPETVELIKNRQPKTKILVITGLPTPEIEDEVLKAGADGFMTKPFSGPDLDQAIENLLAAKKS